MIDFQLIYGDCLDEMSKLAPASIDLICCDLPYHVTKNLWDVVIDPELLWPLYWRVLKPAGCIVLFGQGLFTANMMISDPNWRYNLIWHKTNPTGFLNAKRMPLRSHEDIMIFYRKLPTYNPQKTAGHSRKVSHSLTHLNNAVKSTNYGEFEPIPYDSTERFPTSIWTYAKDKQKNPLSPTQKPVALIEELIKTFSNPGDIVLDNCSGSGTTGEAAILTGRDFILIEKDITEYNKGLCRINKLVYGKSS